MWPSVCRKFSRLARRVHQAACRPPSGDEDGCAADHQHGQPGRHGQPGPLDPTGHLRPPAQGASAGDQTKAEDQHNRGEEGRLPRPVALRPPAANTDEDDVGQPEGQPHPGDPDAHLPVGWWLRMEDGLLAGTQADGDDQQSQAERHDRQLRARQAHRDSVRQQPALRAQLQHGGGLDLRHRDPPEDAEPGHQDPTGSGCDHRGQYRHQRPGKPPRRCSRCHRLQLPNADARLITAPPTRPHFPRRIRRINSAVSLGVRPTVTPTASKAAFLA